MTLTLQTARNSLLILILLGFLSWSLKATASQYSEECLDKNYISQEANVIIQGEVIRVESKYDEGNKGPYTYMDFKVDRYLKGSDGDVITIKQFGGTIGKTTTQSSDFTTYTVGEQGYLHLRKFDESYKNYYGFYQTICGGAVTDEPFVEGIKQ